MKKQICSGCHRSPLTPFLNLGTSPLADYFPATPTEELKRYPLELAVCETCWLVQQTCIVPDDELFGSDYAFFSGSSLALVKHFSQYAEWVHCNYNSEMKLGVAEIACNDGTLLQHFNKHDIAKHIGIDPARPASHASVMKCLNVVEEPFSAHLAAEIVACPPGGRYGVVIANNVLAHVRDIHDFIAGVKILMDPHGVAIFEFQYLPDMLVGNMFDLVYHEHRSFLSLTALQPILWNYGLAISDAFRVDTQGGSVRVVVNTAANPRGLSQRAMLLLDGENDLRGMNAYSGMQFRANYIRNKIWDLLEIEQNAGRTVAGYGASAKSATLLNFCGITNNELTYVVDTTPHKIGKYTPGSGIQVIEPNQEEYYQADTYLMLIPNYLSSIMQRERKFLDSGGKFIVPFPIPTVI